MIIINRKNIAVGINTSGFFNHKIVFDPKRTYIILYDVGGGVGDLNERNIFAF